MSTAFERGNPRLQLPRNLSDLKTTLTKAILSVVILLVAGGLTGTGLLLALSGLLLAKHFLEREWQLSLPLKDLAARAAPLLAAFGRAN